MCVAKSLRKAKPRLPLWGRWTRVSEDGEGKLPAAPSHGLCGSAGGLPSQSPNGDSSPEGGAKYVRCQKLVQSQVSPPPLGEVPPQGAERASCQPHRPLPWLSPLRARAPRSLVSFWLTPHKVKGKVEAFLKKSFTKKL